MKEVIKVSIGQWAFTLEHQAYEYLEAYLLQLRNTAASASQELINVDEVEESLGKYLSTQVKNVNQVVSLEQIRQAIVALGLPGFEQDSSETENTSAAQEATEKVRKNMAKRRLYRHPEQKVLGGVFGGLGTFFNWDPVVLRILYVIFLLVFMFAESYVAGFLLLLYLGMWIAMPLARTQEQLDQLQASNGNEKLNQFAKQGSRVVNDLAKEAKGSQLGHFLSEFFRVFFGAIFTLIGVTGLVVIPMCYFLIPAEIMQFFSFIPVLPHILLTKILLAVCLFIPFLGFFYEGIKLLFRLGFKKLRLGLALVLVWMVSLLALAVSSCSTSRPFFWGGGGGSGAESYHAEQDTFYIAIDDRDCFSCYTKVALLDNTYYGFFDVGQEKGAFYVLPSVKIHKEQGRDNVQIKTEHKNKMAYSNIGMYDGHETFNRMREKQDNRLILHPVVFSENNKWPFSYYKIDVYVPEDMTVIVEYPDKNANHPLKDNQRYFPFMGYHYELDGDIIDVRDIRFGLDLD